MRKVETKQLLASEAKKAFELWSEMDEKVEY